MVDTIIVESRLILFVLSECQLLIDSLIQGGPKQWIPSHYGIASNEIADILTKVTSNLPQPDPPVCYHGIKIIIAARFNARHHEIIKLLL
ncbi:hypothetical protein CDAR_591311 [Caerostris darwini]|uniref:RNase H type-1 domain-containing protein n=1 Tax=Caerostris darwini TaxID=1538125 RepID=A0AAV4RJD5_9ARAC|nr:hypothetical protein CDAR_591311 [Caerostris darwini]